MTRTTISPSYLAEKTQEVVSRVQHGEIAVVESFGQEQAVLLDPLDFRLLRALAQCATAEARGGLVLTDDRAALAAVALKLQVSVTLGALVKLVRQEILTLEEGDALLVEMMVRGYRSPVRSLNEVNPGG